MSTPPTPPSPRTPTTHVLVLGGGPDAEREVSIDSSTAVAAALRADGSFEVTLEIIDRLSIDVLRTMPGDVLFPVLHGGWGEGGPLQDLLESDGRPFVGSSSRACRIAMDKMATKMVATGLGIRTGVSHVLDMRDAVCPMPYPIVIKPIHEGSTIGLHICRDDAEWADARRLIERESLEGMTRAYMIEPCVEGREFTVGVIDGRTLPLIEIVAASGLYDYEAKYQRDDTTYIIDPEIDDSVRRKMASDAIRLMDAIGARDIARVDFMLDSSGDCWLLEINTMPGFTSHSLVPMAAEADGLGMQRLCERLVRLALAETPAFGTGAR